MNRNRLFFAMAGSLALFSFAYSQIKLEQILKVGGVIAVVNAVGPSVNREMNKLTKHKDNARVKTKVVPIFSVGERGAIGMAQVMGEPKQVDRVVGVAQPEADILGGELKIRALIPVSSKDVIREIKIVSNVGVSGIVDLKL